MREKISIIALCFVLSVIATVSCDDNNDSTINGCDRQECEILERVGEVLGIEFGSDPLKWEGVSWTAPNPVSGERHIRGLRFKIESVDARTLPSELSQLYYLRSLYLEGIGIGGDFPESLADNGTLDTLEIRSTSITTLPDNIFNSHMKKVIILSNDMLYGSLPSSITLLKGYEDPAQFQIMHNNFVGRVPALSNVNIWLDNNQLRDCDPANYLNALQPLKSESESPSLYGVWLGGNNLRGELPEELLTDSLKLIHFCIMSCGQRGGREEAFTNLPSYEKVHRMAYEYYSNHPEYHDLTPMVW